MYNVQYMYLKMNFLYEKPIIIFNIFNPNVGTVGP
jgi:hypothetical protein